MSRRERARDAAVNVLVLAGVLTACGGLAWMWAPLGVVALGLCLVALGVILA